MVNHSKKFQAALDLYRQRNLDAAASLLTAQLKKKPKDPTSLHLLGTILADKGQRQKAGKLFKNALKYSPNDYAILNSLSGNLLKQEKYDEAKKYYLRCLKFDSLQWRTKIQLGAVCRSQNKNTEAERYYEEALDINPSSTDALINLIHLRLNGCKLSTIHDLAETIESMAMRCIKNSQAAELAMLVRLAPTIPMQADTYLKMLQKLDKIFTRPAMKRLESARQSSPKIRIAYIASEFGDHPISQVMWDVFKHHDRSAFEIICYSLSNRDSENDQVYIKHIKKHSDQYIDISKLDQKQSADRIAQDKIDILVNLSGYMTINCVQICSFRPAPINVYWLGHGGTLGLSTVDYVIANDIVIPENEWPAPDSKYHSEAIASLPESYHCAPTPDVPECTYQRKDFGLDENSFVFCAFNNPSKIDIEVFDAWMNILKRVPDSQLWLSNIYGTVEFPENLGIEAEARGVDPSRLVFATRIPDKLQHLARHKFADLFLDTFTYNASTTAIDALWMGLPVLTRPGSDFFSKIGSSHTINAGLTDMVCETTQQYEDKAVKLANNPDLLNEIRERLLTTRDEQPLFDVSRFVKHLEAAYQQMFDHQQAGEKPASFRVKAWGAS
jgi:predicted O-linked N-acetylglucosamine transferase (SPINDLY family)